MTKLTDKLFAIPMPEGAESCEIRGAHSERPYPLLSFYGEGEAVELPVGNWRIVVFTTKTATEEQAASVVQTISNGKISGRPQYRRYDRDNELPARMWTRDARHSLESLLRSKGLDENKNYALIEKM